MSLLSKTLKNIYQNSLPASMRLRLDKSISFFYSIGLSRHFSCSQSEHERAASARFSAVVAIHDAPEMAARCFESLERFGGDAEIILVDDGSSLAMTKTVITEFARRNKWKVIRHETALGHSRACEAGADAATREFLCLLNSDTYVTQQSWRPVARVFDEDSNIAVVGPSTSHASTPQRVKAASVSRHFWDDNQICAFAERYVRKHKNRNDWAEVPYVAGFAFFIRKDTWKEYGGFDPNLPDYGNETDLCKRIRADGKKIIWTKNSYIHHFGRQSYGALGEEGIMRKVSSARSYIQEKESAQQNAFTGERVVPNETPDRIFHDHLARYEFAVRYVRGKHVLDAACGTGYGSAHLKSHGAVSVNGVDISDEAIAFAQSRYEGDGVTFKQGDVTGLVFDDGIFDVVVSFETIEHVENHQQYLHEMHRVLKPGGIFIVSSPNRVITSPKYPKKQSKPSNEYHVAEFSRNEFVSIIKRSFNIEKIYGQHLVKPWYYIPVLKKVTRLVIGKKRFSKQLKEGGPQVIEIPAFHEPRYFIAVCRK